MTPRPGLLARWMRAWDDLEHDLRLAWRLQGIVGIRKETGARTLQRVWRYGRYLVFAQDHDAFRDVAAPEGVNIAVVSDADWPALAAILPRRRHAAYRSWVARGRVMLVAWRQGQPVGFLWYSDRIEPDVEHYELPLPPGAVYAFDLHVIPRERGNGIGSALVAARVKHAQAHGFASSWRIVRRDNAAALRVVSKASREDRPDRPIGELTWTKLFARSRTRFVAAPPPSSAPGLIHGMLLYGTTRGITEGLLSLRGVALASILGPQGLGVWTVFRLSAQYLSLASLGVTGGLEREVSQSGEARAIAPDRAADAAARTTLGFLLVVFGVLGAAAGVAACFVESAATRAILFALTVILVTENVVLYALVVLRSRGRLWRYGVLEIVIALLHLVLATLLAARWGLPGAFTGFALASVVGAGVAMRGVPVRPQLDLGALRRLLRIGFPVRVNFILGMALVTADRWVVGGLEGASALGLYAFAVAVAGVSATVAWVARIVVFPSVYREARLDGPAALRRHLTRTVLPFACLLPPLLGAGALMLAPVVVRFLPAYAQAIPPTRILLFTGITTAISSLGALGVIAADRQRWLPALSAAALALNVALAIGSLRAGFGLAGVAVAALVSRLLLSAATLAVFADAAGVRLRRALLDAFVPGAWCFAALLVVVRWFPSSDPIAAAKALAVYILLLLPLVPSWAARVREARGTAA